MESLKQGDAGSGLLFKNKGRDCQPFVSAGQRAMLVSLAGKGVYLPAGGAASMFICLDAPKVLCALSHFHPAISKLDDHLFVTGSFKKVGKYIHRFPLRLT